MTTTYRLLVAFTLLLSGCSPISHMVRARFDTIDARTDSLRLHFRFTRETNNVAFPVNAITVFQDGRLLCTIHGAQGIIEYTFPEIPDGYSITWADSADTSTRFSKSRQYRFSFQGSDEFIAGFWAYHPQFAEPDHRWLFDSLGVYEDRVRVNYQTCVGSDAIFLDFKEPITIGPDSIVVLDSHGSVVAYEPHTDAERPNLFSLELERDLESDETFTLRIPPAMVGRTGSDPVALRWHADDGTRVQLAGPAVQSLRK